MSRSLSTSLRSQLSRVIQDARRVAEEGALRALRALAVDRAKPFPSMSHEEEALRRKLRAHGRQLGDRRDPRRGTQEIARLAHEVAYEHWHRMLFARFLAENELLIEPESGVPISLAECRELARERGEDPWELAARFAQRMLPRIFRPDDPALAVTLAPETRQALERLLQSLPGEVFTADDALGWTYQFWQAERKREVNARVGSGAKVGADELPAVTQLFTEHYMVQFLYHNTIGAWRAGRLLARRPELAETADSEEALRRAVRLEALGGYDFSYLRFVRTPREGEATGPWRPAAGSFDGWPRSAAELRVLDPCCGSGHFLVEGLHILVRLRVEEEGLGLEDAIRRVLAENLFGLEIDPRCTQIAAFALALAAWRLAGRPIDLPPLNVACSGVAPNAGKEDWLRLAERAAEAGGMPPERDLYGVDDTLLSARLREGLEALYDLFERAPVLGSLIDPTTVAGDLFRAGFEDIRELLRPVLEAERDADEAVEQAVAARGMARAAELLAGEYTLVVTNVPYLNRGKQCDTLKDYCERHYPRAKNDLATAFLERCLSACAEGGAAAVVLPQNWLFLTRYRDLREHLLRNHSWDVVARLGPGAFETVTGEVVKAILLVISRGSEAHGTVGQLAGLDASEPREPAKKAALLRDGEIRLIEQARQLENPDSRVALQPHRQEALLQEYVDSIHGLSSGDGPRIVQRFWEQAAPSSEWVFHQSTVSEHSPWGGRHEVLLWGDGHGPIDEIPGARKDGRAAWGRIGIYVSQMGNLSASRYLGNVFGQNGAALIPKDERYLPAIWGFCTSKSYAVEVRKIDQALKVTANTLAKVPFDLAHWQSVAAERYPHGLPEPQSNDPTQWLFHGHPAGMVAAGPAERSPFGIADPVGAHRHPSLICREPEPGAVLQVAVARLLGYRWPAELDPEMRLDAASRAWVERCGELLPFADADGIVCLPAVRGEATAADRLRRLLAAAFGSAWSADLERRLLAAASARMRTCRAESLEEWLRDRFFEEHCKLFHHRPFIWHIWDGRRDGFHALVSYHRLAGPGGEGRRTLESLTYSYLGEWIERQRAEQREGKEGADGRLAAALDLQAQLERILEGEPPCDIFVRWKPLHRQPIGWEPDLDDGVRINIRPFMSVELRRGGRKGAGILRWKPNIRWNKDRGREPESLRPRRDFPWFWSCPGGGTLEERTDFMGGDTFDGIRWNDLHYTNAVKLAARRRAEPGGNPE